MTKLYSILGVDGSGKDYWLKACFPDLQAVAGSYPLPCTQYHHSPYCAAPGLSKLLYKLGALADQSEDAALKAMSLFLKMMLFPGEYAHLQSHFQAATIVSTRHPAIDTVAYSQLFLKSIPLGRPAEENHLFRARQMLNKEEWAQLENFLGQLSAKNPRGSMEELILDIGRQEIGGQIQAYVTIFGTPLPDKILFLNPEISRIEQNLESRKGSTPEIHERADYLKALQHQFHSCLEAVRKIAPNTEIKEILPTLEVEGREDMLAFLTK